MSNDVKRFFKTCCVLLFIANSANAADNAQPSPTCPFKVGDVVYYTPDATGYSKMVMADELKIGQAITITDIVKGQYLVWKNIGPIGGAHCDMFSARPLKR